MKKLIVFPLFFVFLSSFSQEKIPFIDVDEIVLSVAEAAQNEEYEKAFDLLNQISKNDSTYTSALVTKAYYQMALKQFDKAIEILDEGLASDSGDLKALFYQNKGVALANLEKHEEAVTLLDEGLKLFPKNHLLTYNRAVFLEKMGKLEAAVKGYKEAIILNPFYRKAYLQLGNICYKQERISQALMCFDMYLLLDPEAAGTFNVLKSVNHIVNAKNESKRDPNFQISADDEAFEDIDLILTNKIAMNKKYKIDNEIDIAFVRQNHVLFSQLEDFEGNGGFWDTKFVPFYKWIAENGYFDDFVYTSTYSIENEKFKKVIGKKTKNIIAFIELFNPKWTDIIRSNKMQWQGKEQEVSSYYNDYLQAMGKMDGDKTVGYWEFYNENGRLTGKGNFDEEGNRDGEWTWYNQFGRVRETGNYKKGKLEGESKVYHENGAIAVVGNAKNDAFDGEYKRYNDKGALLEKKQFKEGVLEGLYTSYFDVGEQLLEYHIPYKNDAIDQKATEYYANGDVFSEISFEKGVRQGLETKYHANKQKYAEINYVDGELQGSYKKFYANGNAMEVGQSLDGYFNGPWKTFYDDGTIQSEFTYAKGKLDGKYTYYDTDGKLYYEYVYRKGEIIAYKFYSKDGAIRKEAKKKGGEFYYEGHASNGNITSEGLYDISGGKKGVWKFYTSNGVLREKGNYDDNKAEGEYVTYYMNGEKKSVSNYKNDSLTGYYAGYHISKKLREQGWYKNNEAHGEWRQYAVDGTLQTINFYHRGKLHGNQKYFNGNGELYRIAKFNYDEIEADTYFSKNETPIETITYIGKTGAYTLETHHQNKKIESRTQYVNGVKHGKYEYFDFYGNKITTGAYLNGIVDGEFVWYYPNGTVSSKITYLNGKKHGDYVSYYENGQVKSETHYDNGLENGVWKKYYDDGTLESTAEYKDDEFHGRRDFYSPTGKLQLTRFYNGGQIIGYSYLNTDGEELPMIPIVNETAKVKAFYDNGKVSREFEYKNGVFVNGYKAYYYNGQLESDLTYKLGEYHGLNTEYYADGTIKKQEEYYFDHLHGTAKEFYKNGKLKKETTYLNNKKEGPSKSYDSDGKLTKSEIYFNNEVSTSETF